MLRITTRLCARDRGPALGLFVLSLVPRGARRALHASAGPLFEGAIVRASPRVRRGARARNRTQAVHRAAPAHAPRPSPAGLTPQRANGLLNGLHSGGKACGELGRASRAATKENASRGACTCACACVCAFARRHHADQSSTSSHLERPAAERRSAPRQLPPHRTSLHTRAPPETPCVSAHASAASNKAPSPAAHAIAVLSRPLYACQAIVL